MEGIRKVIPIIRPQTLCVHSIKYIDLNSDNVMLGLSNLNSGEDLYFVNSDAQSSSLKGRENPVTGFHSVMLRLSFVSKKMLMLIGILTQIL